MHFLRLLPRIPFICERSAEYKTIHPVSVSVSVRSRCICEMALNKTNTSDTEASFSVCICLFLMILILLKFAIKYDDFDFKIVNCPFLDDDFSPSTSYTMEFIFLNSSNLLEYLVMLQTPTLAISF